MKTENMISPLIQNEPIPTIVRRSAGNDMVRVLCKQLAAAEIGDVFIVGRNICARSTVSLCMSHVGYALERYFSSYTDENGNYRVQRQI